MSPIAGIAHRLAEAGWNVAFTYGTPYDARMAWGIETGVADTIAKGPRSSPAAGGVICVADVEGRCRHAGRMSAASHAVARVRARTGGPKDDGPKILEHLLGWTLVVVLAVFVTRAGLM